jgi:hypothetical protein
MLSVYLDYLALSPKEKKELQDKINSNLRQTKSKHTTRKKKVK